MATFTAIKNKAQSGSALNQVLIYAAQEKKTAWKDHRLVTGHNCVAQSALDEMMTTKRRFRKTDGRMFYQFVQSFSLAEDVTPEEVHAIGLELAQRLFPEFEVVVATHVDADHLHNHLIVNSVSWKDGHKLHQNAADFQQQRQVNDEICMAHGLTVLSPQRQKKTDSLSAREYRSAAKGQSWKFRLMNVVENCMRYAGSREEFIRLMESKGYQVRWEKGRKYITYTTPDGKRCRDNKLHGDKFQKEMMEREFRIREEILHGRTDGEEQTHRTAQGGEPSHREGVGADDDLAVTDQQVAGTARGGYGGLSETAQPVPGDGEAGGGRTGTDGDPSGGNDHRTGWEKERAAYLSTQGIAAQAHMGLAVGHSHPGGVVRAVAALGRTLERGQPPAPVPVTGHSDRKALSQEQRKKIAMGHKADDHEEQQQKMTMNMN